MLQVLACLIRGLYTLVEQRSLALLVLHSLVGDTKLVKECLQYGKTIFTLTMINKPNLTGTRISSTAHPWRSS